MTGIAIHRLRPGDTAPFRAMNRLFAEVFGDSKSYASAPPTDEYVDALLARDHVVVLVAVEGDRLIGALVAYELPKHEQPRSEVYIYDLAVEPDCRRRGVATALIRRLQEIAAALGAWVVFVQADHGDDAAMALYARLGTREEVLHFDFPVVPPGSR